MTHSERISRFLMELANGFYSLFVRHQFLRYLLVGIGNTAFSYGTYAGLIFLGVEYRIASLLALVLGIAVSFITQGTVVFQNATRFTLIKFVVAWMVIYILNILIISMLMQISMTAYLAGAVAIVPVTLASYFILKFAVFGRGVATRPTDPTR